ncbi:MAG: hypothetical protein GWP59_09095 [Chlamydiales bacterium]|nr:hypothetical protein [Chlamydiales bacterium]NCF71842.1 hypothetical protein [Chlamydiales bacterium]
MTQADEHKPTQTDDKLNEHAEALEEGEEVFEIAEEFREPDIDILRTNPFLHPLGIANKYNHDCSRSDIYDTLVKKVRLRTEFITSKIPFDLRQRLHNRLHGYWTGSKLAQLNPHYQFDPKLFSAGSTHLVHDMHIVAICPWGEEAYKECYRDLLLTHKVVSYPNFGCAGTFLSSDEAIRRYLKHEPLQEAIKLDMEMPIERPWKGERGIEYLTHTALDVRDESVFLILEDKDGTYTKLIREHFPNNHIITIIPGIEFNEDDLSSIFIATKDYLEERKLLTVKNQYEGKGFYQGQTYFLSDLSYFYRGVKGLDRDGMFFGMIGVLALFGPDYSGLVWGSTGGAEGAIKAARALYGTRGAQNPADLQRAVQWADQLRKK